MGPKKINFTVQNCEQIAGIFKNLVDEFEENNFHRKKLCTNRNYI